MPDLSNWFYFQENEIILLPFQWLQVPVFSLQYLIRDALGKSFTSNAKYLEVMVAHGARGFVWPVNLMSVVNCFHVILYLATRSKCVGVYHWVYTTWVQPTKIIIPNLMIDSPVFAMGHLYYHLPDGWPQLYHVTAYRSDTQKERFWHKISAYSSNYLT